MSSRPRGGRGRDTEDDESHRDDEGTKEDKDKDKNRGLGKHGKNGPLAARWHSVVTDVTVDIYSVQMMWWGKENEGSE